MLIFHVGEKCEGSSLRALKPETCRRKKKKNGKENFWWRRVVVGREVNPERVKLNETAWVGGLLVFMMDLENQRIVLIEANFIIQLTSLISFYWTAADVGKNAGVSGMDCRRVGWAGLSSWLAGQTAGLPTDLTLKDGERTTGIFRVTWYFFAGSDNTVLYFGFTSWQGHLQFFF